MIGLLLASQQVAVLDLLGEPREHNDPHVTSLDLNRYLPLMLRVHRARTRGQSPQIGGPRWKMIFIWQVPIMFLSYAVSFFLFGLVILVCSPLIEGSPTGAQVNVSSILQSVSMKNSFTAKTMVGRSYLFIHHGSCRRCLHLRLFLGLSLHQPRGRA